MRKITLIFLFAFLVTTAFAQTICSADSLEVKYVDSKGRGVFAKRLYKMIS